MIKAQDLVRKQESDIFETSVKLKDQDLMYIYIKTKYNDNIEIEIKKGALNQFKYFECAVQLFKDSQNYFLDEEQGLISFDNTSFWCFYKSKNKIMKNLLEMVNVYKLTVNGKKYRFKISLEYMHDSKEYVVYGIYSKGKLIYIGSTVDKNNRLRTHAMNFYLSSGPSKMYKSENIEDIEFRVLENEESLCEKWQKENGLSYQYFEIAELGYIETLKPLYNVCGVSREYLERVKIEIEDREELKEKIINWVERNKEDIENLKRE